MFGDSAVLMQENVRTPSRCGKFIFLLDVHRSKVISYNRSQASVQYITREDLKVSSRSLKDEANHMVGLGYRSRPSD